MPALQSNLAGRGTLADGGLGTLAHSLTLTSYASLGAAETFRAGLFSSLRESMVGGRDAGVFRQGPDGPQEQNPGPGGDTVPGAIHNNPSFFLTVGGPAQIGFVNTVGDDDWYRVELVAGQSYVFTLNGSGGTPLADPYLELRNAAGALIAFDDDFGSGINAMLRFTATQSGTYYVNARAFEDPSVSNTGGYTLTATLAPPASPLDSIDYHFTMPGPNIAVWFAPLGYTNPLGDTALRAWTPQEIAAVFAALDTYEAVIPLNFTQAANEASADWILSLVDLDGNVLGYFAPNTTGYGAFDPTVANWTAGLVPGGDSWITLIHEFGHGLGLAHPHDNGAFNYGVNNSEIMQGVIGDFNSYGTFLMNQGVFTTMTYNDGWPLGPGDASALTGGQATPMALDVALLQQRYGANMTTFAGDTIWTITTTASSYRAIWDVGGNDTIVYSGANNATIDLRAATLLNEVGGGGFVSFAQGVAAGFTIAAGVTIENATGGTGADTLIGNEVANTLIGNGGTDTLNSNGGNDRLDGGSGADLLNGGAGVDTAVYSIASTSGSWARNPNGSWTVNGQDTLNSVEVLEFTDRDVVLDNAERTFFGDGTSDLLWRNSGTGQNVVWTVLGASLSGSGSLGTAGAAWTIRATGDFNGDGRDDILWQRNDGLVVSWEMNGFTTASTGAITSLGANWSFLGAGDINFDGRDDIVWQRNDGLVVMWQMDGRTVASSTPLPVLGPEWDFAGLADFNGDGSDDFLWRRDDGLTYIWSMDGSGIVGAAPTSAQVGMAWEIVATGDINRDGREDIVWQHTSGTIVGWQMNGATISSSGVIGSVNPAQWEIVGMGDYNGDGRDDLLFQNVNGTVVAWMLDGASVLQAGTIGSVGGEWGLI